MKIFSVIVLAIFLASCAPVAAPTAAPPTAAPAAPTSSVPNTTTPRTPAPGSPAPNAALDVKNISQTKQANQVTKTANITTASNLGVGQIDLSYPDTMIVGESRTVHLKLSPAQQLVSSQKEATTKQPANSPNFVFKFSGNVDLYPVMNAQLFAIGFEVNPAGRVQQVVDTSSPANWSWVIVAKQSGRQELALTISIPAVVNGADSELTKNLQDLSIVIDVQAQKVAPVSLTDQILQSIANNSGAIVVALIGLLGTILGIIIKMRSDKDNQKKL